MLNVTVDQQNLTHYPPNLVVIFRHALSTGCRIKHIINPAGENSFIISRANKQFLISGYAKFLLPDVSSQAVEIAKHKFTTYQLLRDNRIPTPPTALFRTSEELTSAALNFANQPVILKPEDQGLGRDIFKCTTTDQINDAGQKLIAKYRVGLIQLYISGRDLRVQIIGGKFFAAIERDHANVIGNGYDTIQALIADKNKAKSLINPSYCIEIDAELVSNLPKDYQLATVLGINERLQLRDQANISQGGDVIDISETIHTSFIQTAETIARLIKCNHCAIDFIAYDYTQAITNNGYTIEINSPFGIAYYDLLPGKDIARAIIDYYLA
jgi:cyanophycin synthetase